MVLCLENNLVQHANDSSLKAVVKSPQDRNTVAQIFNLTGVAVRGKKTNANKTKALIISISSTMNHPILGST